MNNGKQTAFPATDTINPATGQRHEPLNMGLTKREYFAAMAMQGLLASTKGAYSGIDIVELTVIIADRILAELEK